jgi:hypothetical protein
MHLINGVGVISTAAVPVVMISACSLLSLAFYNRMAAIVSRLRSLQRECIEHQEKLYAHRHTHEPDEMLARRTEQLIAMQRLQTRGVLRRARFLQLALTCLLGGIGVFVICCLSLELYAFEGANEIIGLVSAALFLIASLVVFAGVCFALAEMRLALEPIRAESALVEEMVRQFDGHRAAPKPAGHI